MNQKAFIVILIVFIVLVLSLLSIAFVAMFHEASSDINDNVDPTDPITPTCSELPEPPNSNVEIKKPVIYLYPTQETKVTVKLGHENNLTTTYPLYDNGWEVVAKPNGDLTDIKTGRNLYALYYECSRDAMFQYAISGFVVSKNDVLTFLEEKLEILGLSESEAEEFIIYWLPQLQQSEYNYIRFATIDEINNIMPLNITPAPDTTIRVLMYFKGIDAPIRVKEQKLEAVQRDGFTVVEWGGCELNAIRLYFPRMPCGGQPIRIRIPFKFKKR